MGWRDTLRQVMRQPCGNHAHIRCCRPPPWPQIACPRLSIDWGEGFTKPTLNPYEVRRWHGSPRRLHGLVASVRCTARWWRRRLHTCESKISGAHILPPCPQAFVALGAAPAWWEQGTAYPMDYYAADGGEWNSTYHRKKAAGAERVPAAARAAAALAARRPAAGAEGAAAAGGAPP